MSDMKFKVGQVWRDKDPRLAAPQTSGLDGLAGVVGGAEPAEFEPAARES